MTNKTNKPLTSQQRRIVDATGWHSAEVSLDFALNRLDSLEEVLQSAILSIDVALKEVFAGVLHDEDTYGMLQRLRKTLTDALGS